MWCRKAVSASVIFALLALCSPRPASAQGGEGEVLVPKDTVFALELLSPLNTKTNRKRDKFDCKVLSPVGYAGAIVSGHIRSVKSSGKANKQSEIDLTFDTITLADGRVGSFNAQVKEVNDVANAAAGGVADPEGSVKAKSRVRVSVKRAALGAALGAGIGALIGGGKGAVVGAAIGASAGAASVLATDGPNLEFAAGTQFTVLLNSPSRQRPDSPAAAPSAAIAAALPAAPAAPSAAAPPPPRFRSYTGGNNLYSLSLPDNWQEFPAGGTTVLAPPWAKVEAQGETGFTHCVTVGVAPAGGRDLSGASDAFVTAFLRRGKYLRQSGNPVKGQMGGRDALAFTLSGQWPATGRVEQVTVYTAMTRGGSLFFFVTAAPRDDLATYRPLFLNILRSVQIHQ